MVPLNTIPVQASIHERKVPVGLWQTGQKEGRCERTRRLTVLDGAAMVSISSWVTQTLPDGYEEEGAGPERQSSSGLVVQVQWEGQAVLKKKSSTTVSQ